MTRWKNNPPLALYSTQLMGMYLSHCANQLSRVVCLTHWGRGTLICISKLTIIGSDNGLSPGRRQAIIWTNAGILLNGPLGTNLSETAIEIHTFLLKKILLKMSSGEWRPFWLGPDVLKESIHRSYNMSLTMMTSSSWNIFRVTGHLWGEFTGPRWIPHTKASDVELWCVFDLRPNKRLSKQWWGWWLETQSPPLWRHCNVIHLLCGQIRESSKTWTVRWPLQTSPPCLCRDPWGSVCPGSGTEPCLPTAGCLPSPLHLQYHMIISRADNGKEFVTIGGLIKRQNWLIWPERLLTNLDIWHDVVLLDYCVRRIELYHHASLPTIHYMCVYTAQKGLGQL